MCNPKTGSPTITLCQLRPNYHIVSDSPREYTTKSYFRPYLKGFIESMLTLKSIILTPSTFPDQVSSRYNSSGVMGGVCKV
jgi:hypothetical protein